MKLDRNTNPGRIGKYAIVKMRDLDYGEISAKSKLGTFTFPFNAVEFGVRPSESFFVLKGKDRFAHAALKAYRNEVLNEIFDLETALNARAVNEPYLVEHIKSLREYADDLGALLREWNNLETKCPD
jgi:hypothetical protein